MISRFKIQNFKSLKDVDLTFSNLNILTGMNGMGKSSVIQSLYLIRNSFQHDDFRMIRFNDKDMNLGRSNDILYQYAKKDILSFAINFDELLLELDYPFIIDKDYLKLNNINLKILDDITILNIIKNQSIFNDKYQYLTSNLISPRIIHERNDYIVNELQSIGKQGEYTMQFLYVNGSRKKVPINLKHADSASDLLKSNLESWLSEISPGVRLNINSIPGDTGLILNYQFENGRELSNSFSPYNVGFGTNYVVPIITALLTAEEGKLIIIESPEVYLHPKGQSKIGELAALAATTGAQIIIETHSDHVINGIRVATKKNKIAPDKIKFYYFDRNHNNEEHFSYASEMKIDSDGRLDYWPEGFMDEWDKNLMELI